MRKRWLLVLAALAASMALVGPSGSSATSLAPPANVNVWVGLKNSDDVGTSFDLMAVATDGTHTASGELDDFNGGSSGFNNAHLAAIPVFGYAMLNPNSFTLTVSVRVSCLSRHTSGTARLWWNDSEANSNFAAGPVYLTGANTLSTSPGTGPKMTADVLVKKNGCPDNTGTWQSFGSWTYTAAVPQSQFHCQLFGGSYSVGGLTWDGHPQAWSCGGLSFRLPTFQTLDDDCLLEGNNHLAFHSPPARYDCYL